MFKGEEYSKSKNKSDQAGQIAVLPELLCPAGSPEALDAAIEGGADAVYLGAPSFNARQNARNFTWEELDIAVKKAHAYGVKIYLTLNTQVYDREMDDYLETAIRAYNAGVDALIVADMGGASLIHQVLPDFELHASTQASGHSLQMAQHLCELGYTRMVCARELSKRDLFYLTENSPIEIEMFVHGALCVSHSGQCLFSSIVGGRSGNRGECAQPCRLPYGCGGACNGKDYPLSLKDLSLADYVPELIQARVTSLKIEGRMKSPEYVYGVARIWRMLLNERRAATPDEKRELSELFSRGGFTAGYYEEHVDRRMLGTRSEENKESSRKVDSFAGLVRKVPLVVSATLHANEPMTIVLSARGQTVKVSGAIPQIAINNPTTRESALKNLLKFGNTPYYPETVQLDLEDGLMVPVSQLNALRRAATEELDEKWRPDRQMLSDYPRNLVKKCDKPVCMDTQAVTLKTARFYMPEQITHSAMMFFDEIYLPITQYDSKASGVILPAVIMDRERESIHSKLVEIRDSDCQNVMIGNLGQMHMVQELGMKCHGDFRLNICNCMSADFWEKQGLSSIILSPEIRLPQLRDICQGYNGRQVIVYGRIPLMTMEKCVLKDRVGCDTCHQNRGTLVDRRGVSFPVLREFEHRNVIYNSVCTWMADKQDLLLKNKISGFHFIFCTEPDVEVDHTIQAWTNKEISTHKVRRIEL